MQQPQLPLAWVEKIFQKLSLVYGRNFLNRWEGQNLLEVQADWAHELAGYKNAPEAIKHALENLPDTDPPTVLQFRNLCRNRPIPGHPALPPMAPNLERVAEALAELKPRRPNDPRAWAFALRDREQRKIGKQLTSFQRSAWREALNVKEEITQ